MKFTKRLLWLLLIAIQPAFAAGRPVALFYMTSDPKSIRDFFAHSSQIDLLVPTWYQVDENGLVTGAPEPAVLAQAQSENLPVMPIVALFNKRSFHLLAMSSTAQAQMNAALIRECKLHGYTGFQFDLENIDWVDRDALSALVANTAAELHRAGLQLSIATRIPRHRWFCEMDLHRLAWRVRSRGDCEIRRPGLPDDLRPEHALDHSWPGRRLAMDRRQHEVRAGCRA
jgi:spore germination protein YaaH